MRLKEELSFEEYLFIQDRTYKLIRMLGRDIWKLEEYKRKFLINKQLPDTLEKETEEKTNSYGRDNRRPVMMNCNLIIGEIEEDYIRLKLKGLEKNLEASHGRFSKANNKADFKYNDLNIEFQFSLLEIDKPLLKECKYKNLLKEYKDSNVYLLQGKYNGGSPLYKLINLKTLTQGVSIERYKNKKEFYIENGEWRRLEEIEQELLYL